jgi:hypothetical protein
MIEVKDIFATAGIQEYTSIRWGVIKKSAIPKAFGVYIIEVPELQKTPSFNEDSINLWLENSNRVQIGERKADLGSIKGHLKAFWKDNETIIYIGQSSSSGKGLKKRLEDFYGHTPGNKGPHSGGYWVKLLNDIDKLKVHYSICENPHEVEFKMLIYFVLKSSGNTDTTKVNNIGSYLPFANLTADIDKKHGIKGAIKEK